MKIAHISDLHLCSVYKKENIGKTKKLIKCALSKGADHIVISGDISDNASEKDYLTLKRILKSLDIYSADKVSLTIGNHDIFGGAQKAVDVVMFPARCRNTNYEEKVVKFVNFFKELFAGCYFPSENDFFPYAKVIGDFLFVGINSIDRYSKLKNPFASNGKVSKRERSDLKKIFSFEEFKNKRRAAIIHHHFYKNREEASSPQNKFWNRIESYTLKLRGKKKLIQLLQQHEVEIVFHGHSHEIREYERGGIKFINAGASVDNGAEKEGTLVLADLAHTGAPEISICSVPEIIKKTAEINILHIQEPALAKI